MIDADEGKYQCLAKNFAGTRTSSKAILLMQGKTQSIETTNNNTRKTVATFARVGFFLLNVKLATTIKHY